MNLLSARDIVSDIVIREILAAFFANASAMSSGTPFGAVNLEDPVTVAGGRLRASYQIRVQSTLALHQTDPTADIAP